MVLLVAYHDFHNDETAVQRMLESWYDGSIMAVTTFFFRGLDFLKRYRKYPLYVIAYGFAYCSLRFDLRIAFHSAEALAGAIKRGRSFIRLGDGEVHIMNGGSIHYQSYAPGLDTALRTVIKDYRADAPYILGLPLALNHSNARLRRDGKLHVWLPAKVMYRLLFPKRVAYGDAHFFYYRGYVQRYLEDYFLSRHLIVVSNTDTIAAFKANDAIPFTRVSFVATPKENAYQAYDALRSAIDDCLRAIPEGEQPLLLVSAGPASKPLVYEYARRGVQACDIGRGIEFIYREQSLEDLFPDIKH